ncbi:MAG: hypothetical protein ACK42H_16325 [Planctomycetota bacterium]|jgi:hypothetical protein
MAEKIKLVQGDTRPQIKVTVLDDVTGAAMDIRNSSLVMRFRAVGSTTVLDTLNGVLLDGLNGIAAFAWNPNSLNVDAGDYEGEIEITFSDSSRQTVYDLLKFKVREDFA